MMKRILTLLAFAIAFSGTAGSKNILFSNGQTDYTIVVAQQASKSEMTAANELRDYLQKVSGAAFRVSRNVQAPGKRIFVGYNARVAQLTGATQPQADDEGFTYQSIGDDIVIYGGSQRGTMYGVFSFLEQQIGIRWYTDKYTHIPQLRKWEFDTLNHHEQPATAYRYDQYWGCYPDDAWNAHNLCNLTWVKRTNRYGDMTSYWGVHTFLKLVEPGKYFATHPEYFSLWKGKRISDGQLCLTHPDVLRICIDNVRKAIRENPGYWCYDVSQNDTEKYCECQMCRALEQTYGGHSGLILWFVNQVARAIKKDFPDKYIGTFAYKYSRQAPRNIRPESNVVVRLCSIECCFAHPIEQCPENQKFLLDLKEWSRLTDHLYIWDYVVDFHMFISPWPNFAVLKPNIQTFLKYGAFAIQEEGQYCSYGGEFAELKSWVLAKLMWNPHHDVNQLVRQFITDYYGAAARYVQQYYDLCQQLVRPDTHIKVYINEHHHIYTDAFVSKGTKLLSKALNACKTDTERERVNLVRMQVMDLKSRRQRAQAKRDGTHGELLRLIEKHQAHTQEGVKYDEFLRKEAKRTD